MSEIIGQSQPRVDGLEKINGQAKFLADLTLCGWLTPACSDPRKRTRASADST